MYSDTEHLKQRSRLDIWIKSDHLDTARAYIADPDAFIRTIDVTINGKLRHLITYMPNEKGYALRILHKAFSEYLQRRYRPSRASYAYMKKKSFLMCVKQHQRSTVFFKSDIHAYFDSIDQEHMLTRINQLRRAKGDWDNIELVTKACFYDNHLPIGFITSPVLSDLFLVTLDRKYSKNNNVIYTRYADDFIVSSTGENAQKNLIAFRLQLERDLGALDLELNKKKTYMRTLSMPGDAIHVLGVNLVRTETDINRITVSDRYIRKTSKAICSYIIDMHINGKNNDDASSNATLAKINGQISFIYQCSQDSYHKLMKMVQIKCREAGIEI